MTVHDAVRAIARAQVTIDRDPSDVADAVVDAVVDALVNAGYLLAVHDAVRAGDADLDAIRARADARYAPDIFAAPGDVNALLDANDALAAEVERLKARGGTPEPIALNKDATLTEAEIQRLRGELAEARAQAGPLAQMSRGDGTFGTVWPAPDAGRPGEHEPCAEVRAAAQATIDALAAARARVADLEAELASFRRRESLAANGFTEDIVDWEPECYRHRGPEHRQNCEWCTSYETHILGLDSTPAPAPAAEQV